MPTIELLSQGDEVVTGQITDTNAAWLASLLGELGFDVVRHSTVGDRLDDLVDVFQQISKRVDICICTGGLGPTDDDLTTQAVANAFGTRLELDVVALEHIRGLYARYNRIMPKVNERQAWLPVGCTRIDNHWGTAPAFSYEKGALFFCLPGVPREMKALMEKSVVPLLLERFDLAPGRLVTLRTTGIGESNLQERVGSEAPENCVLSYRTKLPENHLKLRFGPAASPETIATITRDMATRIGSPVFTIEGLPHPIDGFDCSGGELAEVVARALSERGETVSTAESCTGGLVAAMCTAIPGSSSWFIEGAVTYANQAKMRHTGVTEAQLREHGAVSEPVVRQMAEGIRVAAQTTFGLATSGIAGPGGATPDKPVGTVHIALATPTGTHHRLLHLGGERTRIQRLSAAAVLDLLRRHLQHHL